MLAILFVYERFVKYDLKTSYIRALDELSNVFSNVSRANSDEKLMIKRDDTNRGEQSLKVVCFNIIGISRGKDVRIPLGSYS
jgi:hypothetical protein